MIIYYTYILKEVEGNGEYYYGSCQDLEQQLLEYNAGKVEETESMRRFVLHHFEIFATIAEANDREMFFKSPDGYRWLKEQKII